MISSAFEKALSDVALDACAHNRRIAVDCVHKQSTKIADPKVCNFRVVGAMF